MDSQETTSGLPVIVTLKKESESYQHLLIICAINYLHPNTIKCTCCYMATESPFPNTIYRGHPRPKQSSLTFQLFSNAVRNNLIPVNLCSSYW